MKKEDNIVKYRRPIQINIGIIISIIVFIYVMFHLYTYLTTDQITVYEVSQGTIVANDTYQGLAIRSEEIVNSDRDGYIYYYGKNRSRVGVRSLLYAIDTTGDLVSKFYADGSERIRFSEDQLGAVLGDVNAYMTDYDPTSFQRVYSFKNNLKYSLEQIYSQQLAESYTGEVESARLNDTFVNFYAPHPGVVLFYLDGYEGLTDENLSAEDFNTGKLAYQNLRTQTEVSAGDPVYKMINSDYWKLAVPVSDESLARLGERSAIEVRFLEDEATAWGMCEIRQIDGENVLFLTFDDSVERYSDSRFVNIELLLAEQTGLKIPNSAIVQKTFYVIPKSYFYQGNNSKDLGLMLHNVGEESTFVTPTIYYETDDAYYVDEDDVPAGSQVQKNNSTELYTVGAVTDQLLGVYNVNKGYAVFKQIEIIYQSEDYSIIKTGTSYGIALYDHIVLQGDLVSENEIIY